MNHIDTSDFCGPQVTNQIIRKALHPYPDDLVIVTKVSVRGEDGSSIPAFSREDLTAAVHDNLRNLGLDVFDVVNLRSMFSIHEPAEGSIEHRSQFWPNFSRRVWCVISVSATSRPRRSRKTSPGNDREKLPKLPPGTFYPISSELHLPSPPLRHCPLLIYECVSIVPRSLPLCRVLRCDLPAGD